MNYPAYRAEEIRDRVHRGELSAKEVLDKYLKQIAKHDKNVGAFLKVLDARAHRQAELIDHKRRSGKKLGKLAGVPIAIKDIIHIKNETTTCASRFLSNYKALFDATAVRLLEDEDAVLIGKTNLDEFAMGSSTEHSAYQLTRNPWNLDCIPGGSSGGSAAAVAARMCPLSLGTDTGGSIRQPAALCGVVGFKPTYGRVSRYGLVAFASSLDHIGPFANDVRDIGLIMEVIGQHCISDSTSLPIPAESYLTEIEKGVKGMRVGVPWQFIADLNTEARKNFDAAVHTLKDLGMEVVEVDLDLSRYSIAVYYILATAEASTNLARFDGIRFGKRSEAAETLEQVYDLSREEGFGDEVKRRIMLGTYVLSAGFQDAYYNKARQVRTLMIQQFNAAYKKCDVIAMPTSPMPCFELGSVKDPLTMYLADIYTISANLAGVPGISVPSGLSSDGKPFGLQLLGPQMADVNLCRVARAYEKAAGFSQLVPEHVK